MFQRYLIPVCIAALGVMATTPAVDAVRESRAISAKSVAAIAKKTVVRIESPNGGFGSGVIVGRTERGNKNIYTVLTAAHVVRSLSNTYKIITPPILDKFGQKKVARVFINKSRNIQFLRNVDLAVIRFESPYTFTVGTIGNSEYADEGSPIYVAGFPKPGKVINRVFFHFTGGMISSRLDEGESEPQDHNNNGYDLVYTSVTRSGMSGGPVLDTAGKIIAIHGQGDRNNQEPGEEGSIGLNTNEKTGFNLGIPIQTFLRLQPQAKRLIGVRIEKSPISPYLSDRSYTMGTPHPKFASKFRTRSDAPPLFDVTKVNEKIPMNEEIIDQ
jgi:S1-C subfamily serine protease